MRNDSIAEFAPEFRTLKTVMASLEGVAARFDLDSSHLNKPCTEAFFVSFSDHVHPWRVVFANLLSQRDLDDVDSEQTGCSEQEKRIASLRKWKTRCGNEATFRAVIEAVLSTGNVDSAEALCQIIAGRMTGMDAFIMQYKSPDPNMGTLYLE